MTTIFLTLEEVLIIHEDQIERYGGLSGIRDLRLLESAVYRPQSTFGGEELYETIFLQAAALMHSIILNHPFVDGNKRTGIAAGLIFLQFNNYGFHVPQKKIVETALHIATKEWNIEEIAEWLSSHAKKQ